jgi:hypothetical protein
MDDKKFHDLKFGLEVSARYHEWRRMFLERWIILVRIVSAVGAALSLIGLSLPAELSIPYLTIKPPVLIAIASATIGIVNIIDFACGADAMARSHTELFRRFKELQETVLRNQGKWTERIAGWEADAQAIRRDEPPTMWALYMLCWNQTVAKYDPVNQAGARKVSILRSLTKNLIHYLPHDFPAAR